MSAPDLPSIDGLLSAEDIATTAASIAAMQERCGAIPWSVGEHVDIWNHVEAAMGLLVGGHRDAAERALDWAVSMQRSDGSWPMKIVAGEVVDDRGETNMSAYLAVGAWHHWLICQDRQALDRWWPAVRAGLGWVVSQQQPDGAIRWTPVDNVCLLTGCSSIYQSLRAGVALGEMLGDPQPQWELAGARLGHAIAAHPDQFADKTTFAMDWYYPVLGGAVRGTAAEALIESRWNDYVVPGLGIRCVDTNPWITGAETCELALVLDSLGDTRRSLQLVADMQHLRHSNGSYWTGWVFDDGVAELGDDGKPHLRDVYWPNEQTSYTAAAVILAVDALADSHGTATPGSGIMRGTSLIEFDHSAAGCRCRTAAALH